jgi:excisionase family DNA binding protein
MVRKERFVRVAELVLDDLLPWLAASRRKLEGCDLAREADVIVNRAGVKPALRTSLSRFVYFVYCACCEYGVKQVSMEGFKMTVPAAALGGRRPSASDKAAANHLRKILAAHATGDAKLRVLTMRRSSQRRLPSPPALSSLLMELLRHIGKGDAVTLAPVSKMLTTQQAADILNISRPFLISLLDKGEIEYSLVGRHRRIQADHLFKYKKERDEKRSKALADLAELDAEHL